MERLPIARSHPLNAHTLVLNQHYLKSTSLSQEIHFRTLVRNSQSVLQATYIHICHTSWNSPDLRAAFRRTGLLSLRRKAKWILTKGYDLPGTSPETKPISLNNANICITIRQMIFAPFSNSGKTFFSFGFNQLEWEKDRPDTHFATWRLWEGKILLLKSHFITGGAHCFVWRRRQQESWGVFFLQKKQQNDWNETGNLSYHANARCQQQLLRFVIGCHFRF